ALRGEFALQRFSSGIEVGLHTAYFAGIFLVGAAFEAGSKAHLLLGIDAAGKLGIGIEIVHAASHLEEVERIVHELLGSRAGLKWAVEKAVTTGASQARGDGGTGIWIFEMQLDQWRESEAQTVGISLGKRLAQDLVEQEAGFEVRAGRCEFDPADAIAQVKFLRALFDGAQ